MRLWASFLTTLICSLIIIQNRTHLLKVLWAGVQRGNDCWITELIEDLNICSPFSHVFNHYAYHIYCSVLVLGAFLKKICWSIVDLQCCVNFFCTAKWLSYTYIYSLSYSFPLWFVTGYWLSFPVLYSRTLLFMHPLCNSLPLLIPNSHSFPPPRSSPL